MARHPRGARRHRPRARHARPADEHGRLHQRRVFVDWVRYNAGPTGPAKNLAASFAFTADGAKFQQFGGQIEVGNHRVCRHNTGKRLVLSNARDTVITYYEGAA
jgi:hypothetical protein